jgi:competence protein ComEA
VPGFGATDERAWLPGDSLDASASASVGVGPQHASGLPAPPPVGARWQPDRRAVTAVAVAVVLAGLITAWWVLSARPRHLAVQSSPAGAFTVSTGPTAASGTSGSAGPSPGGASTGSGSTSATGSTAPPLVVDVAGKVRRPGVYRLAAGSRVIDALRAAGGARRGASTTSLNLAAQLQDGEQVLVGVPAQPGAAQPGVGAAGTGAAAGGPVNLNTATLEQLETLPGVGPVLAQRILDWRTQHGSFTSIEQLDEVSGIGPAKFGELRDAVTL